jgi:selenide,water dikinase
VYAMGGEPQVALSFIGMPDAVGLDVLEAVLRGVTTKAHEAGCAIVGGHSIRDAEPKVGLAVVGAVDPERAWTHRRAQAGQRLILTKPVGTGVLAQAAKADRAAPGAIEGATRWMTRLNRAAKDAGLAHGVTSATDVTGFGLLGHLWQLASASSVSVRLDAARVPLLPGAIEAARDGLIPGGSKRNLRYVERHLRGHGALAEELLTLLADAQTSGGLLLAAPPDRAQDLVSALGEGAVEIGELRAGEAGVIEIV